MDTLGIIQGMDDTTRKSPDHQCLFWIASEQHGLFTSAQARSCGVNWDLLSDGTRRGRYIRIKRGLYRLRDYPSFPREEVVAAWLALGKDNAVVSHESALDLHDLSDVIPNAIHITIPRSKRYRSSLPGVAIHTTVKPFGPLDISILDGMRVTSPARTILDAAELGTGPEQIEMAIKQALARGLATRDQLIEGSRTRGHRVQALVRAALSP
jgi:predicted transcriptional regulator of viral defense system